MSNELSERARHEKLEKPARGHQNFMETSSKYFYLQSPGKKLLITGIIYDILCGALQFYVSISSYTAGSVCSQSGLGVDVVTFGNTCSFMDQEFTD